MVLYCLLLCFVGAALAQEPAVTIQFLTYNDIYQYEVNANGTGGMSNATGLMESVRREPSFFSISGDFVGGSQWGEFEGKPMIEILNAMQTDYVVIGNHEFDYGPDVTLERMNESNFIWFGANIEDVSTGEPFGSLIDVHTATVPLNNGSEIIVGFFGVCVVEKEEISSPGPGVNVTDVLSAAKAAMEKLKSMGAQVFVAITHLDFQTDIELAEQNPELSLILGGHEHIPLQQDVGNTLILKCGQNAELLGVVDLNVFIETDDNGVEKITTNYTWERISNDQHTPQSKVTDIVSHYRQLVDEYNANLNFSEVLTTVIDETVTTETELVRTQLTAWGNEFANSAAAFYLVNPALGILNGGAIRGDTTYAVGINITREIVYNEMRFPDTFVRLHIEGRYIRESVQQMLRSVPFPSGDFPQLSSGFNVVYDLSGENQTARILVMEVGGSPVVDNQTYSVVVPEFLANEHTLAFKNGLWFEQSPKDVREVFANYLKTKKTEGISGAVPPNVLTQADVDDGGEGDGEGEGYGAVEGDDEGAGGGEGNDGDGETEGGENVDSAGSVHSFNLIVVILTLVSALHCV